ncbi:g11273 [Coccomyxa viridis]|uniref:G11273 protein n=1 Tax=Coccomyxa viridis TaxID=1274662 RepID=A0ABP1GC95_9CHLO
MIAGAATCSQLLHTRLLSGSFASSSGSAREAGDSFVSLNNLADNPGARKKAKRVGRGIGSGVGKTSGRGHKGQKARTGRNPKLGFEGGQTPLKKRAPKRGFHNPHEVTWDPVNLADLQEALDRKKLNANELITMKTLRDAGIASKKIEFGVKLLAKGAVRLRTPVNIQVSQVSAAAREAVEKAGGTVTTVYYNRLGIRALLKPESFAKKGRLLPRPARPPAKLLPRYDSLGCLPPDALPLESAVATAQP